MKNLTPFILVLLLAACGGGQDIQLPEGITCDDEAMARIAENPPDEKADPNSPEYNKWYVWSYYKAVGCDAPDPATDQ